MVAEYQSDINIAGGGSHWRMNSNLAIHRVSSKCHLARTREEAYAKTGAKLVRCRGHGFAGSAGSAGVVFGHSHIKHIYFLLLIMCVFHKCNYLTLSDRQTIPALPADGLKALLVKASHCGQWLNETPASHPQLTGSTRK